MQPARSRKLTEVHIVGQMYILQSKGINCGAEIHVVGQKYCCGAEENIIYILE